MTDGFGSVGKFGRCVTMTRGIGPGTQLENEKSKSCVFQSAQESREEILKWSRCEKLRFQRKMESQGITVPLHDRRTPHRNTLFHEVVVLYFVCRTKLPCTKPWFDVKKKFRGR